MLKLDDMSLGAASMLLGAVVLQAVVALDFWLVMRLSAGTRGHL